MTTATPTQVKDLAIHCSSNYDQFKPHPMQRGVLPAEVIKLMKSMQKRGFVATKPIIVNSKMEILDGQRRWNAAKNVGVCIYYVIDDTLLIEDVREVEDAHSKWSFDDFVTSHCRQGNKDYIELRKLREESGLPWLAFLYGAFTGDRRDDYHRDIKEGRFAMTDHRRQHIKEFFEKLQIFKELFPRGFFLRPFIGACARMFAHPQYNHEQMLNRLQYQSTKLVKTPDVPTSLAMLEDIYNYRSHEKNIVRFTARR